MAEVLAVAFEGHPIRVTPETPKRAAVLDLFAALDFQDPKREWQRVQGRYSELVANPV